MADTFTTNLNLTKPEPGAAEDTWGISLNADLDALDAIFSSSGTQINLNPNQINFGDNKKAVFGAGGDLEIYHSGNDSFIRDAGIGDLYIRSSSALRLQALSGERYAVFTENGAATFYYDNGTKLATTSTGIDVTGTITSDGILKDTASSFNYISGGNASNAGANILLYGQSHASAANTTVFRASGSETARIDSSGRLGIGTTSPTYLLSLQDNNGADLGFSNSSTLSDGDYLGRIYGTDSSNTFYTGINMFYHDSNDGEMRFRLRTAGTNTDVMTLVDGSVGIGTSSPVSKLSIENTGSSTVDAITLDWEHLSTTTNIEQRIQWRFGDDATADTFLNAGYIGSGKQGSWQSGAERDSYLSFGTTSDNTQTEKMRISADGLVGIGTDSPTPFLANSKVLEISDDSGVGSELILTNDSAMSANEIVGSLIFKNTDASGTPNHFAGLRARAESTFGRMDLEFYAGRSRMESGTPDMVITPSGADAQANVGIGTTSPTSQLNIKGTTGLLVESNGSANYGVYIESNFADTMGTIGALSQADAGRDGASISFNDFGRGIVFKTNEGASNSEAGRILSDGKLLVGKTAASIATTGVELRPNGQLFATQSANYPLLLNRTTSDGDIIQLRKDNTTVGVIGSSSSAITIATGDTGLRFVDAADAISPFSANTQLQTDGQTDLGRSSFRFKDLRLSGTAYAGTVAVNTTSPDSTVDLHVSGGADNVPLGVESTDANVFIAFKDSGTTGTFGAAAVAVGANSNNLLFRAGSAEVGRFTSSGRLGIGTTSPSFPLEIKCDSNHRAISFIETGGGTETWQIGVDGDGDLGFFDSTSTTQSITFQDGTGNIGIGTDSPDKPLHIAGSGATAQIKIQRTNTNTTGSVGSIGFANDDGYFLTAIETQGDGNDEGGHLIFRTHSDAVSTDDNPYDVTERMRIDSSGNLLVGTTDSTPNGLTVNGAIVALNDGTRYAISLATSTTASATAAAISNTNGLVGSITTSGSATAFNTSSDARLKDVTGEARGLDVINSLNPVSYNWKADGKADEGLIAQEVQEIVPNAVSQNEDEYYQMDYSKLVVHLVAGMKEQQAQIEALQSEINLLKGE